METAKIAEDVAFNIIRQAVIYMPDDVKKALRKAYAEETGRQPKPSSKPYSATSN